MCTLSFIQKPGGYLLGMNRDERVSREAASPPAVQTLGRLEAAYPRETGGGTWIGSNSGGITLAVLNQNGGNRAAKVRSRGELIPSLLHAATPNDAVRKLADEKLRGMLPFLLVGFFPVEKIVLQWRWDGMSISAQTAGWGNRHWFSSGISDAMAREVRGASCADAWRQRQAGSAEWLRGLHASHAPVRGSFSVCVHRPEAASVSYTEVAFDGKHLAMRYHAGQPCEALGHFDVEVALHHLRWWPAAG